MAEHRTAGSEIPQSHAAWSNGYGPETVSVEDVVDVWRYAILSCILETTMTIAFSQGHDMLILCSGEVYIEQNAVVKMVGCLSLVL